MFDTSIKENILLGKNESDNFKEIIKQLDIDLSKSITDLSGGEKQKVAIARLLVNPNPIILLDESFSSIDIASSKMILENLSKLDNTTVIMITHRMQELEDIEYETIDILNWSKEKLSQYKDYKNTPIIVIPKSSFENKRYISIGIVNPDII